MDGWGLHILTKPRKVMLSLLKFYEFASSYFLFTLFSLSFEQSTSKDWNVLQGGLKVVVFDG